MRPKKRKDRKHANQRQREHYARIHDRTEAKRKRAAGSPITPETANPGEL